MRSNIELGKKYRDRISGFTGIATGRHEYLNGCVRITITATELHDGKPVDPQTFDTEDLVFVDDGVVNKSFATSGPGDVPAARKTPARR